MSHREKLYWRMVSIMSVSHFEADKILMLWRRWRKVTGYHVYGLLPDK